MPPIPPPGIAGADVCFFGSSATIDGRRPLEGDDYRANMFDFFKCTPQAAIGITHRSS
jgi:hypothetical protein